jgi:EAL domain-containing protein (putative c-di-GMP-specific phosphodiesterase class I)
VHGDPTAAKVVARFPFDKIKIDRCFIKDIAEPSGAARIVQAMVSIAENRPSVRVETLR